MECVSITSFKKTYYLIKLYFYVQAGLCIKIIIPFFQSVFEKVILLVFAVLVYFETPASSYLTMSFLHLFSFELCSFHLLLCEHNFHPAQIN